MMKIGVISDTHLKEPTLKFKGVIEILFKDVDQILHAGDFVDWKIAEYLSSQKELIAVCGNMDSPEIQKAFPQKRMVVINGFKIGLTHGGGAPFGIESRVREEFDDANAIIYGHTHSPANHWVRNVLFFNPGSPTRALIQQNTLGILHLGKEIEGEIIKI